MPSKLVMLFPNYMNVDKNYIGSVNFSWFIYVGGGIAKITLQTDDKSVKKTKNKYHPLIGIKSDMLSIISSNEFPTSELGIFLSQLKDQEYTISEIKYRSGLAYNRTLRNAKFKIGSVGNHHIQFAIICPKKIKNNDPRIKFVNSEILVLLK